MVATADAGSYDRVISRSRPKLNELFLLGRVSRCNPVALAERTVVIVLLHIVHVKFIEATPTFSPN